MKDLYSILNVSKEATIPDMKKSYKKLAFKYHPDKNKEEGSQEIFAELSEAYEILTNPEKKKIYDNFGYEAVTDKFEGAISPIDLFQSLFNVDFTNPAMAGNIFMFSDLSSGPFPPGLNIKQTMKYSLNLTLKELYHGTKKEFTIHHKDKDNKMKKTNYIINIKKGSRNGDNIVVKEGGNYIPELNIVEDLIIQVVEQSDDIYKRKGDDLYIEHTLSLVEALCGCVISINHMDELLDFKIDNIIKPNTLYKLEGKGMPIKYNENELSESDISKKYGDLIIDFKILFPLNLDDKRKDILKKVFNYSDNSDSSTSLTIQYYKDKEDIVKEFMNDQYDNEDEEPGCIQQ
tara:strand:- start:38 stop:1075 length:1038 start_codon:yes stop_codon:yes gene_type:complete